VHEADLQPGPGCLGAHLRRHTLRRNSGTQKRTFSFIYVALASIPYDTRQKYWSRRVW
jgi:hypothetical protein